MRTSRAALALVLFAGCGSSGRSGSDGGGGGLDLSTGGADLATVCQAGDPPVCDGSSVKSCRADGSGYDLTACPGACTAGACTCAPGDLACSGQDVLKCGVDGKYALDHTCPQSSPCVAGLCSDARCPDETMSTNEHALPTNAWPRFRHDNRNTGSTPSVVANLPKLKWKAGPYGTVQLNGQMAGMASGPAVNQKNVVFVGGGDGDGANGSLFALDATGKQLWVFAGNRGYGYTTPAVRLDGTSYFSSADGNAYAVDPTGKLAWKTFLSNQDDSSPIVTREGIVIYGSDSRELFALDATGVQVWKSDPNSGPGEVDSSLAESCDGKILAGGGNGWTSLDAKTGLTLWRQKPGTSTFGALMSSPLVTADGIMYGVDMDGIAVAIDPTGKILWQTKAGPAGAGTSMAKIGPQLFVVLNDGKLHALDAASGKDLWSQPVGNAPEMYKHGGPVVDGKQRLYFASNDGNLYSFDASGKLRWKIAASGKAAASVNSLGDMAIGNDGTLYVPGNDGFLYAFQ